MESEQEVTLSNRPKHDESKKSFETISILVVDSDSTCLAIVAAILRKFKYEVVTVKHANDALCMLRIKGGAFDLVVSDVHIPDMNGFELQQAIAKEFNNLPVVLMSADDEEGVALRGLESGAVFFICKPVCPDDVQGLWQFATMKRQSQVRIHEEKINCNETAIISVSSSAMNEDRDSKKKSPSKEVSKNAKKGEACKPGASQKKTKIVWTNSLHNRFLEAIRTIGLDRAVPKKILEVMNVPGLTRENVASHLQKYRIFLRRVSDASYHIQNPPENNHNSRHLFMTSSSTLESSLSSSPSPTTLMANRFPYRRIGGQYFPASSNSLINQSGIFRQPRLTLPDKGSLAPGLIKLNFHPQPHLINLEGLSTTTTTTTTLLSSSTPLTGPTTLMNPANTISYNANNIATPSNYVGYSISNLELLTGNSNAVKPISVDDYAINNQVDAFDNSFGQLSNIFGDYGLSPNLSNTGNNNIHPMLDMYELESFLAQPLHQGDPLDTSLGNQVNFLNQPQAQAQAQAQAQRNEGETFTTTGNLFGNTSQWDHQYAPSFDPGPNQQYCSQDFVKPQEFLATSSNQLNNAVLVPPNEQGRQVLSNDFQGLDTSSTQLLSKTLEPTVEPDVDEFLESLLAPFGDIQTLEGI